MVNPGEFAREFFLLQQKLHSGPRRQAPELSRGEIAMLGYFVYEKEESAPTELSDYFNLSTARVANTLNSLERKGYIERIHDTKDRRRVVVRARKEGIEYFKNEESKATEHFAQLLSLIGEEDSEQLYRIIRKLEEKL